jgi:preprotein translocase subunit SecE
MSRPTSGGGTTTRQGATPPRSTTPADRAERAANAKAFVEGLASEMRRVTWPSRQEWVSATILTVVLVVVVAIFTYSVDLLFGQVFGLVHK